MYTARPAALIAKQQEDDSWEARAFAEDTADVLGTTWPPRSYTCTFCRREFRSAQALGGHMNVHRRDRARLRAGSPPVGAIIDPSLLFPAALREFVGATGSGLCLLYSFPVPPAGTMFTPMSTMKEGEYGFSDHFHSSAVLSIAPYTLSSGSPSTGNFAVAGVTESNAPIECKKSIANVNDDEELDLELRLGHRPMQ